MIFSGIHEYSLPQATHEDLYSRQKGQDKVGFAEPIQERKGCLQTYLAGNSRYSMKIKKT